MQHFVSCRVRKGDRLPGWMGDGQIKVFGTLHVKVVKSGDLITSIYHMDVERIEPVS